MKVRTAVLWWLVNNQQHPALTEDDMKNVAQKPIVVALFPGIDYYSITGFYQVMNDCVLPALKKQHSDLVGMPLAKVRPNAPREVTRVMASQGYEWQDSASWQQQFQAYLAS